MYSDILIVGQSRKKILQLIVKYLLSAEDIKGLNLQDIAYDWTAHRLAIARCSILGIIVTDVELTYVDGLGRSSQSPEAENEKSD